VFSRCVSADAKIAATALSTRMKSARQQCGRVPCRRYKQLGDVGLEAVLVDSEALDL
jgi:hypothetical protein